MPKLKTVTKLTLVARDFFFDSRSVEGEAGARGSDHYDGRRAGRDRFPTRQPNLFICIAGIANPERQFSRHR